MIETEVAAALILTRPWWLLALVPLVLLLIACWRQHRSKSAWDSVVDPALAPYVLEAPEARGSSWPLLATGLCWLLAVIVLAGPSWSREEVPVFTGQDAQIIVLDLSRSMDVEDLKPSRLAMARFKLEDLLERARGRQVGLVVFSEIPFVVSPLTDDVATLKAFLPALETSVVPVQGSRVGVAIDKAHELLQQADAAHGSIVLLTDGVADERAIASAASIRNDGYSLSVIGVGTELGQPMKTPDGGFVEDASGRIVLPRLESATLRRLAAAGGGVYSDIQPDESDLDLMASAFSSPGVAADEDSSRQSVNWVEHGPLVLPLLLIALLAVFRRGVLG